jgi:hypothetical protein
MFMGKLDTFWLCASIKKWQRHPCSSQLAFFSPAKHYNDIGWALGAAASASRLHRVGRGFESLSAHHFFKDFQSFSPSYKKCMNFDANKLQK